MARNIDFIGIGVLKAATTNIAEILHEHPQICISVPKEVRYFNTYFRDQIYNPNHEKDLNWYFKHFQHCSVESIKGEFSPNYFTDLDAPRRISKHFPNIKLLLCIRNPADRAYSDYQMLRHFTHREKLTFSEAIRSNTKYVENGLYFKHLSRYLEYFSLDKIFVIEFEKLKQNSQHLYSKLFDFLEVDATFEPTINQNKNNRAKMTKFKFIRKLEYKTKRLIARNGGGKFLLLLKKKNIHTRIRNFYTKRLDYPPMLEEDRMWLNKQFSNDISDLENLLKLDLSHWK